jgi:hypothetical protein
MKMQPIETAPKDGTYILLYGPGIDYPHFEVGYWDAIHPDYHEAMGYEGAWMCDGVPTQWAPLPEISA